jgi:hypothetical protein
MTANGQQVENTDWFRFLDPYGAPEMTLLGDNLLIWWQDEYEPLVSSGVQLREIVLTDMASATGPQVTVVPATPVTGDNTANIVPGNVTLSVSFRTASRGRSFRGRNYVVGLTEDQIVGNDFAAGVTASWEAAYTALIAVPAGSSAEWVVVSRFSGVDPVTHAPIPRVAGIATPVTAVVVVDNFVDSARRRLTTRGN